MPTPTYYQRSPRFPLDDLRRASEGDVGDVYGDDEDEQLPPASLAALLPKPDPEMDEKWRVAEDLALQKSQQGTHYGVAEGIRDFAPMAIGSLLDILVNKGKGLGVLAAGGMQALSSEQQRRDAAQKAAAGQALAIRQQREAGADRAIQAQHALLRSAELEQRIAEFKRTHPEMTDDEARQAAEAERKMKEAHTRLYNAQAAELEQYPGAKVLLDLARYGNTSERSAALLELKKRDTAAKEKANAIKEQELKAAADEKATLKRQETKNNNIRNYNRDTKDAQQMAIGFTQIEPTLNKYAGTGSMPGVHRGSQFVPNEAYDVVGSSTPDAIALEQARARLHTFFSHLVTGASSAVREDERNQIVNGLRPGSTYQERVQGLNQARDALRRVLRGWAAGKEEDAREALRAAGIEDFVYGPDADFGQSGGRPTYESVPHPSPATGGSTAAPPSAAPSDEPTQPAQPTSPIDEPPPAPTEATPRPQPTAKQLKDLNNLARQIPASERTEFMASISSLPIDEQIVRVKDKIADQVLQGIDSAPAGYDSKPRPTKPKLPKLPGKARFRGDAP